MARSSPCWQPLGCTATTLPCPMLAGQDDHRADLDLCPRRPALWWPRLAGGAMFRITGSTAEHPERHLAKLRGDPAGRRLWRIQRAVRRRGGPGPITPAPARAHGRRKFFELADIAGQARTRRRSRRSRCRRSSASTFCSISSAVSTGKMRRNGCGCARSKASRLSDVRGRYVENNGAKKTKM